MKKIDRIIQSAKDIYYQTIFQKLDHYLKLAKDFYYRTYGWKKIPQDERFHIVPVEKFGGYVIWDNLKKEHHPNSQHFTTLEHAQNFLEMEMEKENKPIPTEWENISNLSQILPPRINRKPMWILRKTRSKRTTKRKRLWLWKALKDVPTRKKLRSGKTFQTFPQILPPRINRKPMWIPRKTRSERTNKRKRLWLWKALKIFPIQRIILLPTSIPMAGNVSSTVW